MASMTDKVAGAFRKVRRFFPEGQRLFLLERAGHTERFAVVEEITTDWFASYNNFREQLQIEIAREDSGFIDKASRTSYFGYGVPSGGVIDVYVIQDPARDKVPPVGVSPTWKFFGVRMVEERFEIP